MRNHEIPAGKAQGRVRCHILPLQQAGPVGGVGRSPLSPEHAEPGKKSRPDEHLDLEPRAREPPIAARKEPKQDPGGMRGEDQGGVVVGVQGCDARDGVERPQPGLAIAAHEANQADS